MSKNRNKKTRIKGGIRKRPNLERVFKAVPTPPGFDIAEQARKLALEIKQTHSSVQRIIWFPDDAELRILEIDANTIKSPTKVIEPFYFDSTASLPVPSGIAIIRPEEYRDPDLRLPKDWGKWEDGQELEFENE
jgi:hypothetical protein